MVRRPNPAACSSLVYICIFIFCHIREKNMQIHCDVVNFNNSINANLGTEPVEQHDKERILLQLTVLSIDNVTIKTWAWVLYKVAFNKKGTLTVVNLTVVKSCKHFVNTIICFNLTISLLILIFNFYFAPTQFYRCPHNNRIITKILRFCKKKSLPHRTNQNKPKTFFFAHH